MDRGIDCGACGKLATAQGFYIGMVGRVALRVFFPWRQESLRLRSVLLGECELENCAELQVAWPDVVVHHFALCSLRQRANREGKE